MSRSNEWPHVERRAANRPRTGDRRSCASCGDVMRFFERHVVSRGGSSVARPAWVCRCGHEEYVRKSPSL